MLTSVIIQPIYVLTNNHDKILHIKFTRVFFRNKALKL